MGLSRGFSIPILCTDIEKFRGKIFADLAATTRRGIVVAALRSIVKNANAKLGKEKNKRRKARTGIYLPVRSTPTTSPLINKHRALLHPRSDAGCNAKAVRATATVVLGIVLFCACHLSDAP
jgi:hypothetical protein